MDKWRLLFLLPQFFNYIKSYNEMLERAPLDSATKDKKVSVRLSMKVSDISWINEKRSCTTGRIKFNTYSKKENKKLTQK